MKNYFIVIAFTAISSCLSAQKNEFSLTYSPLSLYKIEKMVEGTASYESNYKVLGAINFDYYRYMNEWVKIGINILYDRTSKDTQVDYNDYPESWYEYLRAKNGHSLKESFVFAPQIEFEYLRHSKFKLSSGISIGFANESVTNNGYYASSYSVSGWTFHLNLIKFKWGKKHGLTGNLGAGYKGALSLGYFVNL